MRKNKNKTKRNFIIICMIFILIFLIYKNKDRLFIDNVFNKETIVANNENSASDILVEDMLEISDYDSFSINTETQLDTANVEIEPHIDEETGVEYVTYEDFGAKSDEGFDNYPIMKATHEYANENQYEVRAEEGKTYHVYRLNETEVINIQTNTNWNNANFIIHDESINDKNTRNYAIFQITSNLSSITISNPTVLENIKIDRQTTRIQELAGYGECFCIAYNADKKQFIRSGSAENTGTSQQDFFKIDNEGNVLNEIQWDFENVTSVLLIKIPEETITIQNANFTTILPENDYEQESGYFNRNIICNRSNTVIKNITHNTNNSERIAGPYFGFIRISYASDVTLKDSSLYCHKYQLKSNYDLILENSINVTMDNVKSNDIEDEQRWGIVGSNYTKDIVYKNCELNRIDAHAGVHNLTIENCIIGIKGLTLIGSGELNLKNVTRLGWNSFITLRSDYGSTWNGNINIEDCVYIPSSANRILSFTVTYEDGELHDYGYDLYLPNISINNFIIKDSNSINNFDEIYIFYNTKSRTGSENGDMRNNYNLPQNIIIKNYKTTSGRKLKLFYNKFYNSLNELGINLSMPLSDKEEVNILTSDNEAVVDNLATNKNLKIVSNDVEGIETIVKANGSVLEKNAVISNEGNYVLEILYQNTAGEVEIENTSVTIDKTAPKITGVDNDVTYYKPITLNSTDTDIKELNVYRNEEKIEHTLGEEISEIGDYTIEVSDNAGNTNNTKFEIAPEFELEGENYTIVNNNYIIVNIDEIDIETLKTSLKNNVKYNVYRDEEELENEEIIVTGDIIATENNNKYYLIIKGDNNSDGIFDITDLLMFKRYLIHMVEFDEFSQKSMDLNTDGVTDITDLLITKRTLINAI